MTNPPNNHTELVLWIEPEDKEILEKAAVFFGKPNGAWLAQEMFWDEILNLKTTLDHHNITL